MIVETPRYLAALRMLLDRIDYFTAVLLHLVWSGKHVLVDVDALVPWVTWDQQVYSAVPL